MVGGSDDTGLLLAWLEPPGGAARLRAVLDALAARTAAVDLRLSGDVARAAAGGADAAFGIGLSLLHGEIAEARDLGRCWLWVAASMGHGRAATDLAREIAAEGAALTPRAPAAELMPLVAGWLGRSRGPVLPTPSAAPTPGAPPAFRPVPASALRRPSMLGGGVPDVTAFLDGGEPTTEGSPAAPAPGDDPARPGAVVVPRIGDPLSKEGREVAKRYEALVGRRLPFRGRLPDPAELCEAFLQSFPWAGTLARYLEGQFALLRSTGNAHPRLPPLLLVGPSGCGKTTMLEWLCERCDIPSLTVPVGGTSDSAGLTATARGWVTSHTAAPIQVMADHACCNPAVILDELEKGAGEGGRNGSVTGGLLAMLQPPREGYWDSCLMAHAELKHITFMATVNSLVPLTDALRKRFLIVTVPAPQPEHFEVILPGVRANEARRLGIDPALLPWLGRDDQAWLRSAFVASGGSIRQLEQAHRILMGERASEEARAMQRPH